ncbi:hypothetical protein M407DRAFT_67922 [Tulasnella calospora MUT 4182]|uniref:Fe2OG dioxygenase domain-containing protein n=1 Tax=Tulasnella calospora MUT 4182 TaxID=1051891 RepID=A0A0C3QRN3_9AGAM|nr:hypothetical protein M407DRAFT_67922 [Tulasnella calospora MUT 4182]
MLKSYDPVLSSTVFRLPEPPAPSSPDQPAPVIVHKIDWEEVGFPENKDKVAFIIDNALTPEDCQKLLKAAEDSAPWAAAAVHGGPGDKHGTVMEDYRKSSRILLDDFELADLILSKLRPHMPKEGLDAPKSKYQQFGVEDQDKLKDIFKIKKASPVQLTRLNERLRYLKYVEGDFFESHCDATYWTPDRSEISCLTLQLYLNGSKDDLEGGATQFLSYRMADTFVDVDPRPGRALIFEQGNLLHCGAKVLKGEKYTIRTDLMYKKVSA